MLFITIQLVHDYIRKFVVAEGKKKEKKRLELRESPEIFAINGGTGVP